MTKQDQTKWHSKFAFWALIVGGIFAVVAPLLFSLKTKFGYFDDSTGVIGDTIGGTTAPIIGFVNAVLLYLAFKSQLEANAQIQEQRQEDEKQRREDLKVKELEILFTEISKILREFKIGSYQGASAFEYFFKKSEEKEILKSEVLSILYLMEEFYKRLYGASSKNKHIYYILISCLFQSIFLGWLENDHISLKKDIIEKKLGINGYNLICKLIENNEHEIYFYEWLRTFILNRVKVWDENQDLIIDEVIS